MRLSDIMQNAHLTIWPQIAFIIFGLVFLGMVVRVLLTKRDFTSRMSSLPLELDQEENRRVELE